MLRRAGISRPAFLLTLSFKLHGGLLLSNLTQIVIYGMTVGSVLALVAVGYSLVFSTTRIVNFAHGSMLVVAGYLTFVLVRSGLNVWLAFIAVVGLSAIVGLLVEVVAIRPLGKFDPATNVGWIFTTFAVGLVALDLIKLTIGAEPRAIPDLVDSVLGWHGSVLNNVAFQPNDALIIVTALGLMVALELLERKTMVGRAIRAVAQDKQTASLMGINTQGMVTLTFAMAGGLAAIGAVLLAPRLSIKLESGQLLGLQAFVAVVLGGLGSTRGAILGGYVLGFTGAIVRTTGIPGIVSASKGSSFEPLVVFAIFLIILVVRPYGILGKPQV